MSFNLCTDDVWDEVARYGGNRTPKVKTIWEVKTPEGEVLFTGTTQGIRGKVQKHFGKTARWSKRGRWRLLLDENNYTITKL
jgi:hypothetical protein